MDARVAEDKTKNAVGLKKLDQRRLRDDEWSLIDHLPRIKKIGPGPGLKEREAEGKGPEGGGHIRIMDKECYDCGYGFD
jgi:hypothetical protein